MNDMLCESTFEWERRFNNYALILHGMFIKIIHIKLYYFIQDEFELEKNIEPMIHRVKVYDIINKSALIYFKL